MIQHLLKVTNYYITFLGKFKDKKYWKKPNHKRTMMNKCKKYREG